MEEKKKEPEETTARGIANGLPIQNTIFHIEHTEPEMIALQMEEQDTTQVLPLCPFKHKTDEAYTWIDAPKICLKCGALFPNRTHARGYRICRRCYLAELEEKWEPITAGEGQEFSWIIQRSHTRDEIYEMGQRIYLPTSKVDWNKMLALRTEGSRVGIPDFTKKWFVQPVLPMWRIGTNRAWIQHYSPVGAPLFQTPPAIMIHALRAPSPKHTKHTIKTKTRDWEKKVFSWHIFHQQGVF